MLSLFITNHAHYRSIRTTEERREYHKKYWHTRSDKQTQHETQQNSTTLPITVSSKQEAYADTVKTTTALPRGLSQKTWDDFKDHRKSLKAKLTPNAENRLLAKLEKMSDHG